MACVEQEHVDNRNEPTIQYQWNADSVIVSTSIAYKDPDMVDLMIHYYVNGGIKSIVQYRKGLDNCLIDGWIYYFDSLSQKPTLMEYHLDGIPQKAVGLFPKTGMMRFVGEFFIGKSAGSIYKFDTTGFLTQYLCINFDRELVYKKAFYKDNKPKILFEQEEIIAQYWFTNERMDNANPRDLKVDTNYMVHLVIPKPPNLLRRTKLSLISQNEKPSENWQIHDTTGVISTHFTAFQPGDYLLNIRCDYIDHVTGNTEKADSLSLQLRFSHHDSIHGYPTSL